MYVTLIVSEKEVDYICAGEECRHIDNLLILLIIPSESIRLMQTKLYMELRIYPIHRLNPNITLILSKVSSIDIRDCLDKGLSNDIFFVEDGSNVKEVSEIIPSGIDGKCYVRLSSAYCQYLWLICNLALKTIDLANVCQVCREFGISLADYNNIVGTVLDIPKEELQIMLESNAQDIDAERFIGFLDRITHLTDIGKTKKELELTCKMIAELTGNCSKIDTGKYSQIDFNGPYEELVNAMYCYGITFILLHELSHFTLGHIGKPEEYGEETDADMTAFWDIYSSFEKEEQFTAVCGILSVLFSLLYLNDDMSGDGIHPREDQRIFSILENIKNDNDKYKILTLHMFGIWAKIHDVKEYPSYNELPLDESIEHVKEFMSGV